MGMFSNCDIGILGLDCVTVISLWRCGGHAFGLVMGMPLSFHDHALAHHDYALARHD